MTGPSEFCPDTPGADGSSGAASAEQVVELQLLVTHLQRDMETLNQVVLEQQRQLDHLRMLVTRIDDRIIQMSPDSPTFDPRSERPPHY